MQKTALLPVNVESFLLVLAQAPAHAIFIDIILFADLTTQIVLDICGLAKRHSRLHSPF